MRPDVTRTNRALVVSALLVLVTMAVAAAPREDRWSAGQIAELASLTLGELGALPADPTNRVANDRHAAELGERLFFDTRLSANGRVSCGTCHDPRREFQDGTPLATGVGETSRRTMPIAATAHSPFLFWDGRKDSQWAQALGPLESPVEHGGTRAQYAHVIAGHHRADYERIFGVLPELGGIPSVAGPVDDPAARNAWTGLSDAQRDAVTGVYVNIGKAIAAYERRIEYGSSRFDRYVEVLQATGRAPEDLLTGDEVAGLRLFVGKASCVNCHNGPLLTNNEFHNTGIPARPGLPTDSGRLIGANSVLLDEFNCRSRWSDAPSKCAELNFLVTGDHVLERAFKVPSLRNVADRAPYMHAGQIETLAAVIEHYNRAPKAPAGHSELEPLRLSAQERRQLEAFLRSLSGNTRSRAKDDMTCCAPD
jgi:cytochrome c peroxidase